MTLTPNASSIIELLLAFNIFRFFKADTSFGICVILLFCTFSVVVLVSNGAGNSVRSYPEQSTTKLSDPPSVLQTHGFGQMKSPLTMIGCSSSVNDVTCTSSISGAAGRVVTSSGMSMVPTPLPSMVFPSNSE